MKGSVQSHGYMRVSLMKDGKTHYRYVHHLVCEAFHGPKPRDDMHVAHWDGTRDNNRSDNLRWATPAENMADKIRHGTSRQGSRHPLHKLSSEQVVAIRTRKKAGETATSLAAEFDIHVETVRSIARGAKRPHD